LYLNAVETWTRCRTMLLGPNTIRVQTLRKLIETGDFELPDQTDFDEDQRAFWAELSEYRNLDRDGQIQKLVEFVKLKVPQSYWVDL